MKFHIVGVGGAGMSGVARYLHEAGNDVSGCDAHHSSETEALQREGLACFLGHDRAHVEGCDVTIASPAVDASLPELAHAARTWNRAELLERITDAHTTWSIAGTHGKTTTTSMLTHILVAAGRNPSWLCGQPIRGIGANGHYAGSDLVLETDESFGSFRLLRPHALGILNIEPDHLDYYGTVEAMEQAYVDLATRTTGPVVVRTRHAAELIRAVRPDALEIGDAHDSDAAVTMQSDGSRLLLRGAVDLNLVLAVHGAHNHENAAVAAVLAACQGIDSGAIEAGLRRFHGAPRRFELRGGLPGRVVIDDYAHLPSEIATTIAAARDLTRGRVIVLFQPHRVSRTQNLGATFGPAFRGANEVVVSAIYDAGEPNPQHITSEIIANSIDESGVPVRYIPDMNEASRTARSTARCGDVVLVVGAGDIGTVIRSWEVGA